MKRASRIAGLGAAAMCLALSVLPQVAARVVRGGEFGDAANWRRSAFRTRITPTGTLGSIGFRVVLVP